MMCTMAGNKKAKVFPDPVSAMPTCRVRFAAKFAIIANNPKWDPKTKISQGSWGGFNVIYD